MKIQTAAPLPRWRGCVAHVRFAASVRRRRNWLYFRTCGLSRSQAALRAHVTDGWLSHLEQGRILHPDPRKLRALAAALGCAYEDLMDAAGYTDAQPLPPELRDLMLTLQGLSPRQRNKLLRMVAILLEPEMQEPRLQRPQWVS